MVFELTASECLVGEIKLLHVDWYGRGTSDEGPYPRRQSGKGPKQTSTHSLDFHIHFGIKRFQGLRRRVLNLWREAEYAMLI
jgi:hypothetical protein